jgi:hypothetical protein
LLDCLDKLIEHPNVPFNEYRRNIKFAFHFKEEVYRNRDLIFDYVPLREHIVTKIVRRLRELNVRVQPRLLRISRTNEDAVDRVLLRPVMGPEIQNLCSELVREVYTKNVYAARSTCIVDESQLLSLSSNIAEYVTREVIRPNLLPDYLSRIDRVEYHVPSNFRLSKFIILNPFTIFMDLTSSLKRAFFPETTHLVSKNENKSLKAWTSQTGSTRGQLKTAAAMVVFESIGADRTPNGRIRLLGAAPAGVGIIGKMFPQYVFEASSLVAHTLTKYVPNPGVAPGFINGVKSEDIFTMTLGDLDRFIFSDVRSRPFVECESNYYALRKFLRAGQNGLILSDRGPAEILFEGATSCSYLHAILRSALANNTRTRAYCLKLIGVNVELIMTSWVILKLRGEVSFYKIGRVKNLEYFMFFILREGVTRSEFDNELRTISQKNLDWIQEELIDPFFTRILVPLFNPTSGPTEDPILIDIVNY